MVTLQDGKAVCLKMILRGNTWHHSRKPKRNVKKYDALLLPHHVVSVPIATNVQGYDNCC
ncbi:hypothetical protein OH492_01220 [Vibrio chagasii]|nr:hypothetical protein [Vibrio chagasii]